MRDADLKGRLAFIERAEGLKDTLRSAHTTQGRQESVAAHTWRLMLLIVAFEDLLPTVDTLRLLKMCLLHDLGEVIDGDIPAPQQQASPSKSAKERGDFQRVTEALPRHLKDEFLGLWDDYETAGSKEAKLAKAFDKLETLIQHNQGQNPEGFDYAFNLGYGRAYTDGNPLTAALRAIIDERTRARVTQTQETP